MKNSRGRVIHTNKSRKIFYPEQLSKKILSKDLLDFFNVTLDKKTVMRLILPYFIDENILSQNCFTIPRGRSPHHEARLELGCRIKMVPINKKVGFILDKKVFG